MLKQRLYTAIVLIPLIVFAILKSPTVVIQGLLGVVVLLAAWEWMNIVGIYQRKQRLAGLLVMAGIYLLVLTKLPLIWVLMTAVIVWTFATVLIIAFAHRPLPAFISRLFTAKWFGYLMALLVLIPFMLSGLLLHATSGHGPELLLYVLVTVWLADTGGYFAGKRWGRHHLASVISPNKTWEGLYGAVVLTSVWALMGYSMHWNGALSFIQWYSLTIVTMLISVIGDLFESMFKRCHHVKDSGQLLPGHGGMMDRVDSLVAAVPIFVIGLTLMRAM